MPRHDPLMRCTTCGRGGYLWSTFQVRIETTCTDCLPYKGWPPAFHLFTGWRR